MSSERSSTSRHDSSARCDGINRQGEKGKRKQKTKRIRCDAMRMRRECDGAVRNVFISRAIGRVSVALMLLDQEKLDFWFLWQDRSMWSMPMGARLVKRRNDGIDRLSEFVGVWLEELVQKYVFVHSGYTPLEITIYLFN